MNSKDTARAIRETTLSESGSGKGPRRSGFRERRCDAGAIGQALRSLHDATMSRDMPQDFEALLSALDAADRRGRA